VLLTGLAAGADCLAAEVVLDNAMGDIRAILPLELSDYRIDFTPEGLVRCQALINRSQALVFPPPIPKPLRGKGLAAAPLADDRNAAYERMGFYMADNCQILLAVWDGQPARGRGGTGDVVAYAKKIGRPIAWLSSQPPFELNRQILPN